MRQVCELVRELACRDLYLLFNCEVCAKSILNNMQSPEDLAKIRERMGVLQGYLTSYQARGIPVFSTSLSDMKATMNLLHGYLLECINIQMCQET